MCKRLGLLGAIHEEIKDESGFRVYTSNGSRFSCKFDRVSMQTDFLDAELKAADEGDASAVQLLLSLAADNLSYGEIPDARIKLWMADYLSNHIKTLPKRSS